MSFADLETLYTNPLIVLGAFFILFFLVIFEILFKTIFKDQKSTAIIVSLIISLLAVFYLKNTIVELITFNVFLALVSIAVLFLIAKPVYKFLKIELGI